MINETVAHYRILRKLGAGGMGVVYEAEDTKLGRRVALKFLPEDSRRDPRALERFLREARAASSLTHPSICTIHVIEAVNDRAFISMELLDGKSLDKVLAAGPILVNRTIELGIQVADALDAAHKKRYRASRHQTRQYLSHRIRRRPAPRHLALTHTCSRLAVRRNCKV